MITDITDVNHFLLHLDLNRYNLTLKAFYSNIRRVSSSRTNVLLIKFLFISVGFFMESQLRWIGDMTKTFEQ